MFVKSMPLSAAPAVEAVPKIFEFAQNASMPKLGESNTSVIVCEAAPSVAVSVISVALVRVIVSEPV